MPTGIGSSILRAVQYVDQRCFRRIAHPYPQEGILLHQRKGSDAGAFRTAVLARDMNAAAGAVEGQAVMAAGEAAFGHLAQVQRRAAVAAHVEQRAGVAHGVAEPHHRLVADPSSERLFGDLVGPGLPGIADEHSRALPLLRSRHRVVGTSSDGSGGQCQVPRDYATTQNCGPVGLIWIVRSVPAQRARPRSPGRRLPAPSLPAATNFIRAAMPESTTAA
jgi:hypothetical protein